MSACSIAALQPVLLILQDFEVMVQRTNRSSVMCWFACVFSSAPNIRQKYRYTNLAKMLHSSCSDGRFLAFSYRGQPIASLSVF
jgi:hypothetical protein